MLARAIRRLDNSVRIRKTPNSIMQPNPPSKPPARPWPTGDSWLLVMSSAIVLLMTVILVPAFHHGRYVGLPGVGLSLAAGVIITVAFLCCPRRPLLPKLLIFLSVLLILPITLYAVTSYVLLGIG